MAESENSNVTEVTGEFCHPYLSFGGNGCNEVILRFEQSEIVKFKAAQSSENGSYNADYESLAASFSTAFSIVLFFYFTSLGIGAVLRMLKRGV